MKMILRIFLFLLFAIVLIALFNYKTIDKLWHTIHLFDEDVIVENFQTMDEYYDAKEMVKSSKPLLYPKVENQSFQTSVSFGKESYNFDTFLEETRTEGILIIRRDTIIYEAYFNGLEQDETHISWSMSKSLIATLLGIAHDRGLFQLEDEVTDYLPQFIGTGYDKVKIKNILQMSSGVAFDEDYGAFNSDINRFGRAFALGTSFEDFSKSLKNERPQGTYCKYVSIDTQVLGILLAKITGQSITEFCQKEYWSKVGSEYNAQWNIDNTGVELALGGLNASLRDFSKLGLLYLHDGKLNGTQLVSTEWITAATTPDAPHLMAGNHSLSNHPHGYGFQWWIPNNNPEAFYATGIYNQFTYVVPSKDLVITKLSANHTFKDERLSSIGLHLDMFKKIADSF